MVNYADLSDEAKRNARGQVFQDQLSHNVDLYNKAFDMKREIFDYMGILCENLHVEKGFYEAFDVINEELRKIFDALGEAREPKDVFESEPIAEYVVEKGVYDENGTYLSPLMNRSAYSTWD